MWHSTAQRSASAGRFPFSAFCPLSIALLPLLTPRLWHHHYGKIAAGWALSVLSPMLGLLGLDVGLHEMVHLAVADHAPFIILFRALVTVTGGIRVSGALSGTPAFNTGLLALGTGLASLTGTTGAAMLLIRPLIRANARRRRRGHVVIFFVFLVADVGGSLTLLGDPPLFLGFLHGVPFFWPTVHLLPPVLLAAGLLLFLFWVIDGLLAARETRPADDGPREPLRIEGLVDLPLLLAILLAVLASGSLHAGSAFTILDIPVDWADPLRDLVPLAVIGLPLRPTDPPVRAANEFGWAPILEVAKLFAGIFVTMAPVLAILEAGARGVMAPLVALVSDEHGRPVDLVHFWITGRPLELPRQCTDTPRLLQLRGWRCGDAHHEPRRYPRGRLGRYGLHGRQYLHRQRAQFHVPRGGRGDGRADAELPRLHALVRCDPLAGLRARGLDLLDLGLDLLHLKPDPGWTGPRPSVEHRGTLTPARGRLSRVAPGGRAPRFGVERRTFDRVST